MAAVLNKKGLVLIAAIMLIVFASIAVLGVTVFIAGRLHQVETERVLTRCIYLAQAGIQNAIYWFRFHDLAANGYFSLGQDNIDAANFFVVGATAADLLMVNTSGAALGPAAGPAGQRYRQLLGLTMQNATDSKTISIDRMLVAWDNSARLREITIGGSSAWSGNERSPADCDITDFTLNTTSSIYNIDSLRFGGDMSGVTAISIEFIMTDGTSKSLAVYPASNNYSFSIQSTGKTSASNIYRTISAEYNALSGKIGSYREINAQITP